MLFQVMACELSHTTSSVPLHQSLSYTLNQTVSSQMPQSPEVFTKNKQRIPSSPSQAAMSYAAAGKSRPSFLFVLSDLFYETRLTLTFSNSRERPQAIS